MRIFSIFYNKIKNKVEWLGNYFKSYILSRFLRHSAILVYHRVADVSHDPLQLCVSPQNFRKQIIYLKENFNLIPLSQMINDLKSHKIKEKSVAITFDDGYADNLYTALPILEELNAPATIFITTGNIDSQEDFYWDKNTAKEDRGRSMTIEELKKISTHPLIEVGAHTVYHPNLRKIVTDKQYEEINQSKIMLERILDKKIVGFAYPFGSKKSFSKSTISEVKKAGFRFACANTQEKIYFFSDLFAIPRILARNWDSDILAKKLK
ncbi:MAG: NodB y protein [Parcubacteria group bacterium]|nr:NodB y protein [Parcubacteria group bacterium]